MNEIIECGCCGEDVVECEAIECDECGEMTCTACQEYEVCDLCELAKQGLRRATEGDKP